MIDDEKVFIERFTESGGKITDVDVLPAEWWSCAALTCCSLVALISFTFGIVCGILIR